MKRFLAIAGPGLMDAVDELSGALGRVALQAGGHVMRSRGLRDGLRPLYWYTPPASARMGLPDKPAAVGANYPPVPREMRCQPRSYGLLTISPRAEQGLDFY